jgi:ElaB/YqjD/DUF883 family membrane-anchored ribosome-binding protein
MDFATHDVQQGREETRAALTEKIEMLEQRVRDSVEDAAAAVKRTVDVDYQINHHPWRMFGLSLFFGYVAGLMLPARFETKNRLAKKFVQARQRPEHTDKGDEISIIKAAMVGAMTGLIHDIVREGLPVLASYLNEKAKNTNFNRPTEINPAEPGTQGRSLNATPLNH